MRNLPTSADDREVDTAQRLGTEAKIADLILKGHTRAQIVDMVKVNPSTLRWYIHKLTEEWRERGQAAIDVVKSRELAKLDLIEREAWAAWERSQADAREETIHYQGRREESVKDKHKAQVGDAKFLDVIFKCIEKRLRLFGITEIGPGHGGGSNEPSTDLAARLARYDNVLLARPAILLTEGIADHNHSGEPVDPARSTPPSSGILDADFTQR